MVELREKVRREVTEADNRLSDNYFHQRATSRQAADLLLALFRADQAVLTADEISTGKDQ